MSADTNILDKITPEQRSTFDDLCRNFKKSPLEPMYLDSYGALMCSFPGIVIGIEKDGYAHS